MEIELNAAVTVPQPCVMNDLPTTEMIDVFRIGAC